MFGSYTCPNTDYLFHKQFKYSNHTSVQHDGACEYCCALENSASCLVRKYTTFSNYKKAIVYHCGQHNCAAKEISERSSDIMTNANTRDCSATLRAMQSRSIITTLRSRNNWQEAEKNAKNTGSVKVLSNEKVKKKKVLQPDGVGFKVIKELKRYTDFQGPFFVYNINESQQSIFKNSTSKMKDTLEMDIEGDYFLKDKYCHLDDNHKGVKESIKLVASVYHPFYLFNALLTVN